VRLVGWAGWGLNLKLMIAQTVADHYELSSVFSVTFADQ